MHRSIGSWKAGIAAGTVLALAAMAPAIGVQNSEMPVALVGVTDEQAVRVSVLNTGREACQITVSLTDLEGNLLGGPDTKMTEPGRGAAFDVFIGDPDLRVGDGAQMVTHVAAEPKRCDGLATTEVYDPRTGETG